MRTDRPHFLEIVLGYCLDPRVLSGSAIERLVFQRVQRPIAPEIFGQASIAPIAVNPEERQLGAGRLNGYQRRPDIGRSFIAENFSQLLDRRSICN